jgi:hypothetical protein
MIIMGKTPLIRFLGIAVALTVLHLPGVARVAQANGEAELQPPQGSRQDMIADLILQRPFGLATTFVGIGTWIVALPFTVFSGSAEDAGQVLVAEPAAHTFVRPLGYPAPVGPER